MTSTLPNAGDANSGTKRRAVPRFVPGEVTVYHHPEDITAVTNALTHVGKTVVFVPTMGALHEGHLTLVEHARRISGAVVVVSIFVNPLQFNDQSDLDAYPRTLEADIEALKGSGAEIVFAPSAADMYPNGPRTTIHPGPLGEDLEGEFRPGHFAGMLTVVAKLFNLVRPKKAYFGEKDFQQLMLVHQMCRDLNLPVEVVGVPTVRESDGLAKSSRNVRLDSQARQSAAVISAALTAGAYAAEHGAEAVLNTAREVLASEPTIEVEYLELRTRDLRPDPLEGEARLLIAAQVGGVRLIDNVGLFLGSGFRNLEAHITNQDPDTGVAHWEERA